MNFDKEFYIVANRLANGLHLREGQFLRVPVDEYPPVFEGIALQRRQPPFHVVHGVPDRQFRRGAVPAPVGPDAVAHLAAQQFVDRHAQGLALDVPERDLDAADRTHLDDAAAHVEVVVKGLPVPLDLHGVFPGDDLAELVHHRCGS